MTNEDQMAKGQKYARRFYAGLPGDIDYRIGVVDALRVLMVAEIQAEHERAVAVILDARRRQKA
jgi:hypothetical protein